MRILLIVVLLLFTESLRAQNYWGRTQAGNNVDETLDVTGDAAGNSFATGYFSTLASIGGTDLTSAGLTDIFVTRVNADGNTAWSIRAGGSGSDRGLGITADGDGNIFVCGYFTGTASFGGGVSVAANAGSQDAFTAKYGSDGALQWVRAGGSSGNSDRANAVAADAQGNVYVTGQFSGSAVFGTEVINSAGASADVFTAKYSPDGDLLWVRSGSGPSAARGLGITVDGQGAAYVCGTFSGNITFENAYNTTILNALFVVKYNPDGSEAWMRYAGGSEQSIAYDITSDGNRVYLVGDCGQAISWPNTPGTPSINTGSDNAVFLAALDGAGSLVWGASKGSDSPVSGRAVHHRNGELAVAGHYECTFDGLSEEYGEANFNSIGFRDVFVMRYTTNGAFLRAQNFGSRTSEQASGVHIHPDGIEAVSGTFTGNMHVPAVSGSGYLGFNPNPQFTGTGTYCDDPDYGLFRRINGAGSEDGFLIKALAPEREPYDYYRRFGSACDRSIPQACAFRGLSPWPPTCPDTISGCSPVLVTATNYADHASQVGYSSSVQWSTGAAFSPIEVGSSATVSAVFTSEDGCYTAETPDLYVEVFPNPPFPLISDDVVVNDQALVTETIVICPGEIVELTGHSDFPGVWSSSALPNNVAAESIQVTDAGSYNYTVTNEFGCTRANTVLLEVETVLTVENPVLNISTTSGDTLRLCPGESLNADVTEGNAVVPADQYNFEWSSDPPGLSSTGNGTSFSPPASGWYTIFVELSFDSTFTDCLDFEFFEALSDSVYVELLPGPSVSVQLGDAPAVICPGDTVAVAVLTEAENLNLFGTASSVVEGDTILVTSSGSVGVIASVTNEFGCTASAVNTFSISGPADPSIVSSPSPAVVCPGDSVLLTAFTPADSVFWSGPDGTFAEGGTAWVSQPGDYFAVAQFYPGCALVSNTLDVAEYATPFLLAENGAICPDSTLVIAVNTVPGSDITWGPPFDGSDAAEQEVDGPGEYTVQVESCGFVTELSILVEQAEDTLALFFTDTVPVCAGDTVWIAASSGFFDFSWTGAAGQGQTAYTLTPGPVITEALDQFGCPYTSDAVNAEFEPVPDAPEVNFEQPCIGDPVILEAESAYPVTWYTDFPDVPVHTGPVYVIDSVQEVLTLLADAEGPWCRSDSTLLQVVPKPRPDLPFPLTDAPVCTGTSFVLEVLSPEEDVQYFWRRDGQTVGSGALVSVFAASTALEGTYAVTGSLDGCPGDTAEIAVTLIETVPAVLPPDTAMCMTPDFSVAPDTVFAEYLWHDGSELPEYVPQESGSITVQTTDQNGCKSFDEMLIEWYDCEPVVPNVFTPNGDGRNDLWIPQLAPGLSLRMVVYNRWGVLVYESDRTGQWWNGNYLQTGEPCPEGVYYYILEYLPLDLVMRQMAGPLTLVRD